MKTASKTKLVVSVLFLLALFSFVGCELTPTSTMDELSADSRKAKAQKDSSTASVESTSAGPVVYTGTAGDYRLLPEDQFISLFYPDGDARILTTFFAPEIRTLYPEPLGEIALPENPEFELFEQPVFRPYVPTVSNDYDPVLSTSFTPELYFYLDTGEQRIFTSSDDLLGTHILIGYNTIGDEYVGENIVGLSIFEDLTDVDYTSYDNSSYTAYENPGEFVDVDLYAYYDGDELVFVDSSDPLATHIVTGKRETGYTTVGYQQLGEQTIGYDTLGYTVVGERTVGWLSQEFILWAGQDNEAGTVTLSNDNDYFYISIDTNSAADLQEVHVYAYTDLSALPDKRPAPGQAPYSAEQINADVYELSIPMEDLGAADTYYFIIHAALNEDGQTSEGGENSLAGETAYAGGGDPPSFDGKGAWFYVLGFTPTPLLESITEDNREDVKVDVIAEVAEPVFEYEVELLGDDDDDGEDTGDYFPVWAQDISHIILVFDLNLDGDNDGYFTVKIDGWPDGAERDLDNNISTILSYLYDTFSELDENTVLLGSSIKGGQQTTAFYAYGEGDNNSDDLPSGIGFSYPGGTANESPQNAIDRTINYYDIF